MRTYLMILALSGTTLAQPVAAPQAQTAPLTQSGLVPSVLHPAVGQTITVTTALAGAQPMPLSVSGKASKTVQPVAKDGRASYSVTFPEAGIYTLQLPGQAPSASEWEENAWLAQCCT
ncbi:hypothetical protein ACFP81_03405 [Deinococcus lacus]|uniref:Uncharacterized protein n=1 Tax=Deinococcus lacus TaxID=392561 RepID=A0ABW1YB13_9DEIO